MPASFKIKTPGPNRIVPEVRAVIRKPNLMRQIAEFIRSRIYQFTKRGLSLANQPEKPPKLDALSPGYVRYRKELVSNKAKRFRAGVGSQKAARKKAIKSFGEFFAPARSNLTLTGQLLNALKTRIDTARGEVTVFVADTRRAGEDLTNAEVAEKVAKGGRPFLGLDRTGRDRVARLVIAELRRSLKRR
jgi:hypothetical protein